MPKVSGSTKKETKLVKNRRRLFVLLAILLTTIAVPTTGLAYAGFVPVVTPLLHTNKPVDLGVVYTHQDYKNFQEKTLSNVSNFDPGAPAGSLGTQLVIFGANSIKANLTQEELTAFINTVPWATSPLTNSQVRLSPGTFEYSGNIKSAYVSDLIQTLYPDTAYENLNPILKMASYLHNPAVYVKFAVSAENVSNGPANGQLHLKVTALRVNRTDLSDQAGIMNEVNVTIPEGSQEQGIAYSLSSLLISAGKLDLYGTVPAEYSVGDGDSSALCDRYHGGSIASLAALNGRIGSIVKYCE